MSKSFFLPALFLFLIACSPAVETEVPQPEEAAYQIPAEILEGLTALNYQPGKTFQAANVVELSSGRRVEVATLELAQGYWTQLETGQWIVLSEYVEEDLAFEYLDTYEGEAVINQVIMVYEVAEEAGKTSYYPNCDWLRVYPNSCALMFSIYASNSPHCPCLSFCNSSVAIGEFAATANSLILIPCR